MLLLISLFIPSILGQGLQCEVPAECVGNAIHVEVDATFNQCLTHCKQFPNCNWVTLFTDINRCVFFADCFLVDDCSNCISGQVDCAVTDCGNPGFCDGLFVGVDVTDTEVECLQLCKDTPQCQYYSFFNDTTCMMTQTCLQVDQNCEGCVHGQVECKADGNPDLIFDKLLVVGGTNTEARTSYDVIDLSGNNEQCAFDSELPFTYGSSATFMDDLAIFCGGANLGEDDNCFTLNPQNHSWSPAPIDMVRARHYSSSVMLNDSAWWIMSGMYDDSYNQKETEVCSTQDGCRLYKDMPDFYFYPLVVKVNDTHVFFLDGYDVYMFNTLTETWTPLSGSPISRNDAFAGLVVNPDDGSKGVLVTGGSNTNTRSDIFDLEAEEWRSAESIPRNRYGGISVQFGPGFLMVGGKESGEAIDTIYQFDGRAWHQLNQTLSVPRDFAAAILVPKDFVTCN